MKTVFLCITKIHSITLTVEISLCSLCHKLFLCRFRRRLLLLGFKTKGQGQVGGREGGREKGQKEKKGSTQRGKRVTKRRVREGEREGRRMSWVHINEEGMMGRKQQLCSAFQNVYKLKSPYSPVIFGF